MPEKDLFDGFEDTQGMVRPQDLNTSHFAAAAVSQCKGKLHKAILEALAEIDLTDEELERLPQFRHYGPTTVSKRRTELYQAGKLITKGERKNVRGFPMNVWGIPS